MYSKSIALHYVFSHYNDISSTNKLIISNGKKITYAVLACTLALFFECTLHAFLLDVNTLQCALMPANVTC